MTHYTFIQDFLVILKRTLQNVDTTRRKVMSSAGSNLPHTGVLPVMNGLNENVLKIYALLFILYGTYLSSTQCILDLGLDEIHTQTLSLSHTHTHIIYIYKMCTYDDV